MGRLYAFIDEFGNNGLDFDNPQISTHFIIAAIIVDEDSIPRLESHVDNIRKQYFQGSEMKSNKVGKNHQRRFIVLQELLKEKFSIYTLIVDKRHLYSDGFKYKKSFHKFLSGLLYRDLYRKYPRLQIVADELGNNSYMSSFKTYVLKKHIPDLFSESSFGFANSKSTALVQIADFVAGTLARKYDESVYDIDADIFIKMMISHLLPIEVFPNSYKSYIYDADSVKGFDERIAQASISQAVHFIEDHRHDTDEKIVEQVKCLEYLVFYFRYIDPSRYVSTNELIKKSQNKTMKTQYFRMNVIAPLRDSGVIISSSSSGYKIPMNIKDIYDFVNHSSSIIHPMVARLQKARNTILQISQNEIDILAKNEHTSLKAMTELLNQ